MQSNKFPVHDVVTIGNMELLPVNEGHWHVTEISLPHSSTASGAGIIEMIGSEYKATSVGIPRHQARFATLEKAARYLAGYW